jgi:hypothetical protein
MTLEEKNKKTVYYALTQTEATFFFFGGGTGAWTQDPSKYFTL